MSDRARSTAFALFLALAGCIAALLISGDAFAGRRVSAHVSRPQPQRTRQTFRPSVQSRTRTVSGPSFNRSVGSRRPNTQPRIVQSASPGSRRVGSNSIRPHTFGTGGSSHPVRLGNLSRSTAPNVSRQPANTAIGRPLKLGNLPRNGSLGTSRPTGNATTSRPFNLANLPKANSLGAPRQFGGSNTRPFNLVNLPKPNSLGNLPKPNSLGNGPRQLGTAGNQRPFNVASLPKPNSLANLPKPNSLGNGPRQLATGGNLRPVNVAALPKPNSLGVKSGSGSGGAPHAFSLANLPKPNSLAGAHGTGNGGNALAPNLANAPKANTLAGGAHQGANLHAFAKKDGAVVNAAEKVGADQKQVKDDKTKLNNDAKNVAGDKTNEAKANAAFAAADAAQIQAQNKLTADKKNNAPAAIIAADLAKLKAAGSQTIKADVAFGASVEKLAQDKKAEAADKKNVSADNKALQQDKKTLSDKQKIAQQSSEIGKLKTALKNANGTDNQSSDNGQGSNNQSSDNGQGSNNQSSDNGQGSSSDNANTSTSNSRSGSDTTPSRSVDNSVVNNDGTVVAGGTSVAADTGLGVRAAPVLPAPVAAAQTPAVSSPDPNQDAAINQTFVLIGFQKDAGQDDVAAFLKAYDASIVDGPNSDGLYKLQLASPVPSDQVQQVLDSMKSQTNIVLSAVAEPQSN